MSPSVWLLVAFLAGMLVTDLRRALTRAGEAWIERRYDRRALRKGMARILQAARERTS